MKHQVKTSKKPHEREYRRGWTFSQGSPHLVPTSRTPKPKCQDNIPLVRSTGRTNLHRQTQLSKTTDAWWMLATARLVANTDSGAAGGMAPHDVLTLKTCECHLIRERGLCRLN